MWSVNVDPLFYLLLSFKFTFQFTLNFTFQFTFSMNYRNSTVAYTHEDRQWDARFNTPTEEYLEQLLCNIRTLNDQGKFKYILVSGVEIGTRPHQNDYQCKHVHVAIILHNRMSKSSLLRHFGIVEGHGYYLVPRNRELPYAGWRSHHIKPFSKVDANLLWRFFLK